MSAAVKCLFFERKNQLLVETGIHFQQFLIFNVGVINANKIRKDVLRLTTHLNCQIVLAFKSIETFQKQPDKKAVFPFFPNFNLDNF